MFWKSSATLRSLELILRQNFSLNSVIIDSFWFNSNPRLNELEVPIKQTTLQIENSGQSSGVTPIKWML